MGTDIHNLTRIQDRLQDDDVLVVFDRSNSSTRSASVDVLNNSLGTIRAIRFVAPNLIIETNDGQTFTVNIST